MHSFRSLPLFIKAIILGLILAPIGNFAATFSTLGVPHWYYPWNFVRYSAQVSAFDLTWNSLLLISGCLLLFKRKLAWATAVAAIFFALVANFYNWYFGRIEGLNTGLFILTSIGSAAMLGILFYFRYPHLDRRDRWFSKNDRLPVTTQIQIVRPVKITAMLINISTSGALLEVPEAQIGNFPLHAHLTFALPTGKHIEGQVVRSAQKAVAVSFDSPIRSQDLKF